MVTMVTHCHSCLSEGEEDPLTEITLNSMQGIHYNYYNLITFLTFSLMVWITVCCTVLLVLSVSALSVLFSRCNVISYKILYISLWCFVCKWIELSLCGRKLHTGFTQPFSTFTELQLQTVVCYLACLLSVKLYEPSSQEMPSYMTINATHGSTDKCCVITSASKSNFENVPGPRVSIN